MSDPIPTDDSTDSDAGVIAGVKPDTHLNEMLWIVTVAVWSALALASIVTWSGIIFHIGPINFNWGGLWLIVLLAAVYVGSVKMIDTDERGASYFFGTYLRKLLPGLHFVPIGTNVRITPHDLQTIIEPGPRDKIFWDDEKEDMPDGMVRPIFMNTRPADPVLHPEETGDLDVQLVLGLGYTVLWTIEDPATFYANIRSIEEADEQIREMSVSALGEIAAEGTAEEAITRQQLFNQHLRERLSEATENWGISIKKAALTIINTSHPLAASMRDRAEASFERKTTIIRSDGEGLAIERLGEARGKAARAEASGPIIGRAEGMAATVKVLGVDASEVLASETARATIPGANATILGEAGLLQVGAVGALVGAGLKSTKPKEVENQ